MIHYDPAEWVTVTESTTCSYHRKNPGKTYASCTCSASWGQRRATPEEYKEQKIAQLEKRAESLQEELHSVLLELSLIQNAEIWQDLAQR